MKAAHRPGCGPALADDAGGEEQLFHIVSGYGFCVSELGQIDGEHRPEQRFVCAAECPAQVLFGCRTSIGSPDADRLVRAGVTLDSPLPVVVRPAARAFGQCELATVASASHRRVESRIVATAGKAEQHCGEEVEQRRLAGFVRPAHDHETRGEVVDPEIGQPSEAVDVEARDAHGDSSPPQRLSPSSSLSASMRARSMSSTVGKLGEASSRSRARRVLSAPGSPSESSAARSSNAP